MKKVKLRIVAILFLFFQFSYCQLTDFTLSVLKTDETCTGNGTLNFTTSNTTSGASIVFSIYLLPNTTNPLAVLTNNNLSGLTSGTYRVVALQTLGNLSNTQQQDIEIIDARIPLVYQIVSEPLNCYNLNGTLTINVSQGTPSSYEIISGPVTFPPQASNIFTNLGVGTYVVRVNDECGDGIVQTHTIVEINESNLSIAIVQPTSEQLCNLTNCEVRTFEAQVTCSVGTIIHYPIQIQTTVYPPNNGTPIITNQTITSGDSLLLTLSINIPYFNVPSYSYDIKVIGTCGEESQVQGNVLSNPSNFEIDNFSNISCANGILLKNFCNLLPPFQVNFLSAPAGFNPAVFNPNNLGPFDTFPIHYDSTSNQSIPEGDYTVQITDSCGNSVQHDFVLMPPSYSYTLTDIFCSSNQEFYFDGISSLIFVNAPPELGITLPYDVSDLIILNAYYATLVPGTYLITGTDTCGNVFSFTFIIPVKEFTIQFFTESLPGCSGNFSFIGLQGNNDLESVIMIQGPPLFANLLPYDVSSSILSPNVCSLYNYPTGTYVFLITDVCGNKKTVTVIVMPIISNAPLIITHGNGCGSNSDSIACISPNGGITEFVIISAPSSFPFPLPYDVSFNIATNGYLCMNSLPAGTYVFHSKDECHVERNETIQLTGFQATESISINPNCGSFNLDLQFSSNNALLQSFWLQKFNSVTNQWEHPLTGTPYPDNSTPNASNSYLLTNQAINYNVASTGLFRVLINYSVYQNGVYSYQFCTDVIKTFEFTGALNIDSGYTITCNSGALEVVIVASGVAPFTYKITTKNGQPFIVDNGNSNLFVGLESAIYNFQILDSCGNILNKLIDLNTLAEPVIIPNNLCDGLTAQLSVPAISYLNYQWWKGTDTTTILSTTNTLSFNPFSSATTPGTYYVRVYSTTPISCIDKILSFVVLPANVPNAGQDGQLAICGAPQSINLFTLLNGNYDSNGTWQEITNSGGLSGNIWSPTGINYGSYIFNYTVSSPCAPSDEAIVTIDFFPPPPIPMINGNTSFCSGQTIELLLDDITNATFDWTGPNGFSSNNQNISIENATMQDSGDYTVKAFLNGCQTSSTISIVVNPNPDFTFEDLCIGTSFTIKVIPVENSFDPSNVTYSWSGPNSFSSSASQIVVTNQQIGSYSLTITDSNACFQSKSIDVQSAVCDFPNFITPNNDGSNDYFDLSGFDVDRLEIYSRWGRLVYEANDYINNWQGQNMNNQRLPDSTYFYVISLRSGEQKIGWVLLAQF
jgi:gliding motility-associated-like protein